MGSLSPKDSVVGFANSDGVEGSWTVYLRANLSTGGLQRVLKDGAGLKWECFDGRGHRRK